MRSCGHSKLQGVWYTFSWAYIHSLPHHHLTSLRRLYHGPVGAAEQLSGPQWDSTQQPRNPLHLPFGVSMSGEAADLRSCGKSPASYASAWMFDANNFAHELVLSALQVSLVIWWGEGYSSKHNICFIFFLLCIGLPTDDYCPIFS